MSDNLWQPSSPLPWPDQVNMQLSRFGVGLEDHERKLAALINALNSNNTHLQQLDSYVTEHMAALYAKIYELQRRVKELELTEK